VIMHTVVLADDHPLLLRGLCDLLAAEQDIDVVGACSTGREAVALILSAKPSLAVLDVAMPPFGGLEAVRVLKSEKSRTKVILLTATLTNHQVGEAVRLGVNGILLKETAPEDLVHCMRRVIDGEVWIPDELMIRADVGWSERGNPDFSALTIREREIVAAVCRGLSNKRIAMELGMSEGTVKSHLHSTYQKLGIENRLTLATLGFQLGQP
jgi:DNA-binding NarL/FixJ family response regulator